MFFLGLIMVVFLIVPTLGAIFFHLLGNDENPSIWLNFKKRWKIILPLIMLIVFELLLIFNLNK